MATWRFHAARTADFETPWAILFDADESWRSLVAAVTVGAVVISTGALSWGVWRGRVGALSAGSVVVGVFLLTNSVYSPQYTLWVLPLLVMAGARLVLVWPYVLADLGVFIARNLLFVRPGDGSALNHAWSAEHEFFVLARWLLLALAVVFVIWDQRQVAAKIPNSPVDADCRPVRLQGPV